MPGRIYRGDVVGSAHRWRTIPLDMAVCSTKTYVPLQRHKVERVIVQPALCCLTLLLEGTLANPLCVDRKFITWLQGWVTWTSWIALLAGITNIAANVTTVLVNASYPNYSPQGWHTVLIMYAYLVALGLLNMYGFWLIPWIELIAGLLHVTLWLVFAVVLLTLAPRHSNEFVFFEKANMSGWSSDFVSFNLGIVLITWGFVGFDAVAHISEVRTPFHLRASHPSSA